VDYYGDPRIVNCVTDFHFDSDILGHQTIRQEYQVEVVDEPTSCDECEIGAEIVFNECIGRGTVDIEECRIWEMERLSLCVFINQLTCEQSSCVSDSECISEDYCAKSVGVDPSSAGFCERKPEICTTVPDPVCGWDGVTYLNSCLAAASGENLQSLGPCP
jgi:hypothetical protein